MFVVGWLLSKLDSFIISSDCTVLFLCILALCIAKPVLFLNFLVQIGHVTAFCDPTGPVATVPDDTSERALDAKVENTDDDGNESLIVNGISSRAVPEAVPVIGWPAYQHQSR